MSFLERFRRKPEEDDPSSEEHPAAHWIQEASDAADQGIELKMEGLVSTASTDTDVGSRVLTAIDRALEMAPQDADLWVAKAGARMFAAGDEDVPTLLRRALEIDPNHFDARMRLENPESWQNPFLFPSFSEDMRTLPQVMGQYLQLNQLVQVVRDKLKLTLAIVLPSPSEGFPKIDRSRWELMWVKTPFGRVAEHYTIIDVDGEARFAEGVVPHIADEKPGVRGAYWILRRMPFLRSIYIVFADGHRVLYASKYELPDNLRAVLREMGEELERSGPTTNAVAVQQAANWHIQNFDPSTIRF